MADEKLKIIIEAQDKASTTLKNVQGSINSFNSVLSNLMALGGVVSTITLIGAAVGKALEFGEAGAKIENLRRGFERMTESVGVTSDKMLAQLKSASAGMMSETELMQNYNRVFALTSADIANNMPQLIQVAMAASAAGMGDFDYMLNSMVTGIGRLSPMILDNLGLTVSLEGAYAKYAATVGKSAEELTKSEQQQAVLNEILSQAQDKFGNLDEAAKNVAGSGIAQLKTAIGEYVDYLKTELWPTLDETARKIAIMFRENIGGTDEYYQKQLRKIQELKSGKQDPRSEAYLNYIPEDQRDEARQAAKDARWKAFVSELDVASLSLEQYAAIEAKVNQESIKAGAVLRDKRRDVNGLAESMSAVEQAALAVPGGLRAVGSASEDAAAKAARLAEELKRAKAAMDLFESRMSGKYSPMYGGQGSAEEMINAYSGNEQIGNYQLAQKTNAEATANAEKERNYWIEQNNTATKAGASAYDDLADKVKSYLSSWQSSVQGLITPSMDYLSIAQSKLPYQENWDERARQAAALVQDTENSMKQAWFGGFASQTGLPPGMSTEQIQQWAANYIKEFNAGMRPEDLNLEAFGQRYQELIQQQAGQKDMVAAAQQYLISQGLGPDNELVMKALGFDAAAAGMDQADQFLSAFANTAESKSSLMKKGGEMAYKSFWTGLWEIAKGQGYNDMMAFYKFLVSQLTSASKPPTTPLGDVS